MDIELKSKIDVFNDTYKDMRKNFMFDGKKSNVMKALLAFTNDDGFDVDKVKEIRKYLLNSKVDIYKLRYRKMLSMLIYDSADYKKLYYASRDVYDHLTAKGFNKNKITLCIAVMLCKNFNGDKLQRMVDKTILIKNNINTIDSKYSMLLALADKDISEIDNELKVIEKEIKSVESYTDSMIKMLASSIIISKEDVKSKLENCLSLICNIKSAVGKINHESLLFIGIASLIIEDSESFANELENIYSLVSSKKKNNTKIYSRKHCITISLIILICKYIEETKAGIIESKINDDYLDIIQDYVICLMYFI